MFNVTLALVSDARRLFFPGGEVAFAHGGPGRQPAARPGILRRRARRLT